MFTMIFEFNRLSCHCKSIHTKISYKPSLFNLYGQTISSHTSLPLVEFVLILVHSHRLSSQKHASSYTSINHLSTTEGTNTVTNPLAEALKKGHRVFKRNCFVLIFILCKLTNISLWLTLSKILDQ